MDVQKAPVAAQDMLEEATDDSTTTTHLGGTAVALVDASRDLVATMAVMAAPWRAHSTQGEALVLTKATNNTTTVCAAMGADGVAHATHTTTGTTTMVVPVRILRNGARFHHMLVHQAYTWCQCSYHCTLRTRTKTATLRMCSRTTSCRALRLLKHTLLNRQHPPHLSLLHNNLQLPAEL
jgi:hypothetical protein